MVERSKQLPVVVDFWAEWCGPCRQLTPALERAAGARGQVELAKVDTDQNQGLGQRFRVQGIPAVKAFRNGEVASEFTGAMPPAEVERFFDALVPSEADELAAHGDEASLRRALELDPRHPPPGASSAGCCSCAATPTRRLELLEGVAGDFVAEGLLARAALAGRRHADAFDAWDEGDHERALELLQEAIRRAGRRTPRPPARGDGRDLHRAGARRPARSDHRRRAVGRR